MIFEEKYSKAKMFFKAFDHRLRIEILKFLLKNEDKEITVTTLYLKFRIEQSVMSQHLAILRQSRLVTSRRVGKYIYYSLDKSHVELANTIADTVIEQIFKKDKNKRSISY